MEIQIFPRGDEEKADGLKRDSGSSIVFNRRGSSLMTKLRTEDGNWPHCVSTVPQNRNPVNLPVGLLTLQFFESREGPETLFGKSKKLLNSCRI